MKGRIVALWTAAVIAAAAAFIVHLALRFETVRLGYEVSDARKKQRALIEQRRLLAIEAATLRLAPRVETVARRSLGMDAPKPTQVVPIRRRGRRRRMAGRFR